MLSAALASSSHPVSQSATDFSTGFTPQSAFPGVFLGYRPHLHRKLGLCRVLDISNFRYPTPSGSHPTHPHFEHIFEKINHPMTLTATGLNPAILYPVSLAFLALPKNPADSLRFWKSLLCLDTHSPALAVFLFFGISIWSTWSFLKGVRINATWSKPQSVFPPYTTNASFGIQPGKPNPTTKRSKTFSSLGVSRHHVFNGLANGILWRRDEPEPDFLQSRGVRFSAVKVKVAFWNHPQQYGKPFDSLDLNPERRTSHQEFLWMVWTSHQKLCRNLFWFVEE